MIFNIHVDSLLYLCIRIIKLHFLIILIILFQRYSIVATFNYQQKEALRTSVQHIKFLYWAPHDPLQS